MITDSEKVQERFHKIEEALKSAKRLIVLTHNNPDPDSVSSAAALVYIAQKKFKIPAKVKYTGIVGRAENRTMIRILKLKATPLTDADFKPGTEFALVDMQPKTGNSQFPKNRKPAIIIDHHPLRKTTKADFADVRTDYGATATILTEYLLESGLEIPTNLATALSYGISSETQDLGREANERSQQDDPESLHQRTNISAMRTPPSVRPPAGVSTTWMCLTAANSPVQRIQSAPCSHALAGTSRTPVVVRSSSAMPPLGAP